MKWSNALIAAVGLLVLYVLSLGPVAWFSDNGYLSTSVTDVLSMVYSPLVYAATSSETAESALIWYLEMWESI